MDNYQIADAFSLLAKLMDMHGENAFKAKSYSSAAYTIERLPMQLAEMNPDDIAHMKGIGESNAAKIIEMLQTGSLTPLEALVAKTPPGILEMMQVKGLGPKKIATIWKEMEIESIGELLYACEENRLLLYKGFGEKTQQNIREAIEFLLKHQHSHLYAEVEPFAAAVTTKLNSIFPGTPFLITGAFRRQMETIDMLEWVTSANMATLKEVFTANEYETVEATENKLIVKGAENIPLCFYIANEKELGTCLFNTSCSDAFLAAWQAKHGSSLAAAKEEEIFTSVGETMIPAFARDQFAPNKHWEQVIDATSIRGIIHSHSNWSDGSDTIEAMAKAAIEQGLEYLVISDHSKSAFYANGLSAERIRAQHQLIDELNKKYPSFRIFKSIEADILNDGALDYSDDILTSFDLVIASVHSNLKMPQEKAMMRLMRAIENKYTTILGHMTGRLLLSRKGYPIDHQAIIDACVANHVAIEINAHPRRLDLDWRWIAYAMERGAMLSINPDAHAAEGFADVRYGVLAAQKGALTAEKNLSSFSRSAFEQYLKEAKAAKGI